MDDSERMAACDQDVARRFGAVAQAYDGHRIGALPYGVVLGSGERFDSGLLIEEILMDDDA